MWTRYLVGPRHGKSSSIGQRRASGRRKNLRPTIVLLSLDCVGGEDTSVKRVLYDLGRVVSSV